MKVHREVIEFIGSLIDSDEMKIVEGKITINAKTPEREEYIINKFRELNIKTSIPLVTCVDNMKSLSLNESELYSDIFTPEFLTVRGFILLNLSKKSNEGIDVLFKKIDTALHMNSVTKNSTILVLSGLLADVINVSGYNEIFKSKKEKEEMDQ